MACKHKKYIRRGFYCLLWAAPSRAAAAYVVKFFRSLDDGRAFAAAAGLVLLRVFYRS